MAQRLSVPFAASFSLPWVLVPKALPTEHSVCSVLSQGLLAGDGPVILAHRETANIQRSQGSVSVFQRNRTNRREIDT